MHALTYTLSREKVMTEQHQERKRYDVWLRYADGHERLEWQSLDLRPDELDTVRERWQKRIAARRRFAPGRTGFVPVVELRESPGMWWSAEQYAASELAANERRLETA